MTLIVKIGGAANVATVRILDEVAELVRSGERIVLLHGGSDLTNELSEQLGHPVRTVTSPNGMTSRYTDAETLHIFAMAVAGAINTELVAALQQRDINALGLCGVDGRLLVARRKAVVRTVTAEGRIILLRDDYTGQIEQVNASLLEQLLAAGYTPVIAPLALSYEGERLNVDGDRAASAVAVALQAETLVLMTNVPGLLRDINDPMSLLSAIPITELENCMTYAHGRMRKKLLGAQEALCGGVAQVCIGNESLHAVLHGAGTTITTPGRDRLIASALDTEVSPPQPGRACHSERSEESVRPSTEILRCAQNDRARASHISCCDGGTSASVSARITVITPNERSLN